MWNAREQLVSELITLIRDEEVGMVDRVQAHSPTDATCLERQLEPRQRHDREILLRERRGLAHVLGLVVRGPGEDGTDRLDAREHRRKALEQAALWSSEQIEEHKLAILNVARRRHRAGRRGRAGGGGGAAGSCGIGHALLGQVRFGVHGQVARFGHALRHLEETVHELGQNHV